MSNNLENKIGSQIKSGKLKLRSRYIFLAEKLGLGSALALSLLLAVLFCSLVLFYLKETDNLVYLSFGRSGLLAFLDSFPYLLVTVFIFLLLAAGYLITKTEWSYKKPFKYFVFGLLAFVLLMGSALAMTDVVKKMEEQAFSGSGPGIFFKPFFNRGIEMRGRGVVGKIYELGDDYLIIETPQGFEKISLLGLRCPDVSESINCKDKFEIGQFIIAIGKRKDNIFVADKIQIAGQDRFPPMIRRGIHRKFEPFTLFFNGNSTHTPLLPPYLFNFNKETKDCLNSCFANKNNQKECFDECAE